MGKDRENRDKRELNKYRSKRAIAINKMILELTADLD